jgi:hypothetical protein
MTGAQLFYAINLLIYADVDIGLLIVVFLWFRPQGVLPERRRLIGAGSSPGTAVQVPNDLVTLDGSQHAPGQADAARDGSVVGTGGAPSLVRYPPRRHRMRTRCCVRWA